MTCLICSKEAEYTESQNGPLCKGCWLGLKMFAFKPELVGRARKYLVSELKAQKGLKKFRKMSRQKYFQSADHKFNQIVRNEGPVKIPPSVRKVKVIKRSERFS